MTIRFKKAVADRISFVGEIMLGLFIGQLHFEYKFEFEQKFQFQFQFQLNFGWVKFG